MKHSLLITKDPKYCCSALLLVFFVCPAIISITSCGTDMMDQRGLIDPVMPRGSGDGVRREEDLEGKPRTPTYEFSLDLTSQQNITVVASDLEGPTRLADVFVKPNIVIIFPDLRQVSGWQRSAPETITSLVESSRCSLVAMQTRWSREELNLETALSEALTHELRVHIQPQGVINRFATDVAQDASVIVINYQGKMVGSGTNLDAVKEHCL